MQMFVEWASKKRARRVVLIGYFLVFAFLCVYVPWTGTNDSDYADAGLRTFSSLGYDWAWSPPRTLAADWSRTRAYGLGLNGLYLNLRGREKNGIVSPGALGGVPARVLADNTEPWSGDHCVDYTLVPGVVLSNRKIQARDPALTDIAPTILSEFGISRPTAMQGHSIFTPPDLSAPSATNGAHHRVSFF